MSSSVAYLFKATIIFLLYIGIAFSYRVLFDCIIWSSDLLSQQEPFVMLHKCTNWKNSVAFLVKNWFIFLRYVHTSNIRKMKWSDNKWTRVSTLWKMVFCFDNCSDLQWKKIVENLFGNSRLKAKNLQTFWDH